MMGNSESCQWAEVFSNIKHTHDAAYIAIDEAIKYEEQEDPVEAIEQYKTGIALIDEVLCMQIECPQNPDVTWEKARVMIQKMKKTRGEVLTRINSIQSQDGFVAPVPPPSYEEAMSTSSTGSGAGDGPHTQNIRPHTYSELALALNSMTIDEHNKQANIIFSHDNVKLYFISPDGTVTLSTELQTLKIGIIDGFAEGQSSITFLQVGEWIYPLVPGVSPCYRTGYGAYILPDLHSDVPGSSVGIILPAEVDVQVSELLEDILHGIIREQVPLEPIAGRSRRAVGISDTISQGIVTGAYYIQQGLIKGAEKAGDFMNYGTPKLMNNITPTNQDRPIPNKVKKSIKIAENVSSTAVNVTGFIANKVGSATMALGKYLAPHIQTQGTRLLTTGFKMSENEASEKVNGVLTVAAGAVEGFATVYKGLESSAGILGNNLKNNTVKIVEHKYGRPSGELAGNTLNTVGNLVHVSHNINYMTPKGIAKHTVKETGKAIVEERRHDLRRPSGSETHLQNNLYPNLIDQPGPSNMNNLSNCNAAQNNQK